MQLTTITTHFKLTEVKNTSHATQLISQFKRLIRYAYTFVLVLNICNQINRTIQYIFITF
jgi:hypothetical protein